MSEQATLAAARQIVGSSLDQLAAELGTIDYSDIAGWHRRRAAKTTKMGEMLTRELAAKIVERWDGARVTLLGVSASSSSGVVGALRNWLAKTNGPVP